MSRMDDLLEAAAAEFHDGTSPFRDDWLLRHGVTSRECMTLSELIGDAVRNYARLDPPGSAEAAIRISSDDPVERQRLIDSMRFVIVRETVAKRLNR